MTGVTLSVVIPCYNEAGNLEALLSRTRAALNALDATWEILCVDDGSSDDTYARLQAYRQEEPRIKILQLSRNFGKEAALTAGLQHASGEAVVPLDADLQDPPEVIPELVAEWRKGAPVVLATRRSRKHDTWPKALTADWFYKLLRIVSNIDIPANTGDFRLMDRQVVDVILSLPENTRFMKGLFAWAGFPVARVYFDRPGRECGKTSWSYWKLWNYALQGLFSFSTVPLAIWSYVGAVISLLSFGYAGYLIVRTLWLGVDVPGYPSLMAAILFMGGIQLISIGVIGQYVGKVFAETKRRPLYVVYRKHGFTED